MTSAPPRTISCTSTRPPSPPISLPTSRPPRRTSWPIPSRCWPRPPAGAPVTAAAWHQKKSWALVATRDHNINPDLERSMAKRAGSETIEVPASHAVYVSKPNEVARLIERAAKASGPVTLPSNTIDRTPHVRERSVTEPRIEPCQNRVLLLPRLRGTPSYLACASTRARYG